jgi:D-glycero-D-manno-heptose 1,7-bisphosphate phosphatase
MTPGVFLDRDGTLIEESGYLDTLDRLQFFPYTVDAVRLLNHAGIRVAVITNQSGIARGLVREAFVAEAHRVISERLAAGSATVDGYYYCPHHPDAAIPEYRRDCDCRKPRAGMLRRAASELGIDPARSFVVGDRWADVQAAREFGARSVLVRTGVGRTSEANPRGGVSPDATADNLMGAIAWIFQQS